MGLFLQILLAVFIVIVALLLLAYVLLRIWLKRIGAQIEQLDGLLEGSSRPARLALWPGEFDDHTPELKRNWLSWHALGFRKAGDYESGYRGCQEVRLAIHPDHKLGLLLCHSDDGEVQAVVLAITQDRQLYASSSSLGPSLKTRSLNWLVEAELEPQQRVDSVLNAAAPKPLQPLTRKLLKSAFEQAWARLMDTELASGPPSRHSLAEQIRAKSPEIKEALIDEAHEQAIMEWRNNLHYAVQGNWQRKSRIEAAEWERMQDRILIVDEFMGANDLRDFLPDDAYTERLIDQFVRQGLVGIELFEAIQERMPRQRRYTCLMRFTKPVRSAIFDYDDSDEASSLDIGAQAYPFVAVDEHGQRVDDVVLARSSKDAHRQIENMGYGDIDIINEPSPGETPSDAMLDPELSAISVRALREPLSVSLLRSMAYNSWIWLPPLILLGWSLYRGAPYGWWDWLIFGYAGLAFLFMLFVAGPMVFFHQMQLASIRGRFRTARTYMGLMRLCCRFLPLPPGTLLLEECKLDAQQGQVDKALQRWQEREADLEPETWLSGLIQIQDHAGNFDEVLRLEQQLVDLSGEKDVPRIDLALTMVRYHRDADGAEALISGLDLSSMAGFSLAGYHYVRGLILAERGQHAAAINQYHQAVELAGQFRSLPLMSLLVAEVNGYAALSMRAKGERDKAEALWLTVWPLIRMCTSSKDLIQRWKGPAPGLDQNGTLG